MKSRKVLATLIAILMMCTAVNLTPIITASAKVTDDKVVSASVTNEKSDSITENDNERKVVYPTYPAMKKPKYTLPKVKNKKASKTKKIKLNKSKITMFMGKSAKLKVKVTPKSSKAIDWNSSNYKIAGVENGVIYGLKEGQTTIKAKTTDGTKLSAKCTVIVRKAVTSIDIKTEKKKGNKVKLKVTVYPKNAYNKKIKWITSKDVKIDKNNVATYYGKKYGIIEAKSCDGSNVHAKKIIGMKTYFGTVNSIKLGKSSIKLKVNKTYKLKPIVDGKIKLVNYRSYNNKVAKVSSDGIVKGVHKGKTKIKIISADNNKSSAICEVTVVGHNYGSWHTKTQPTCSTTGLKVRKCKYCNYGYDQKIIKKNSHKHTWNNFYTVIKKPTCTKTGLAVIKCKECKKAKRNKYVIPALGHYYDASVVSKEATCTEDGLVTRKCKTCGNVEKSIVKSLGHEWKDEEQIIKPATFNEDGEKSVTCKYCSVKKEETIDKINENTIKFEKSSLTYNGKLQSPKLIVKDSKGNNLNFNTDYDCLGTNAGIDINEYKLIVSFKGSYSGTKELIYKIVPKGTTITSLTSIKKQITVKWNKQTNQTTGYVVYYATKQDLSDRKYIVIKNNLTVSQTIKGLKSGTKYYVAVRTIKEITLDGKTTRFYATDFPRKTITVK